MNKNKNQLTKREAEVLQLLSSGLLYKEIGYELTVTIDTVKKHTKNIYKKLNVPNRTEATNQYTRRKIA
jgi:two-component system, NarL family, response regulator LiaR